MQSLSAYSPSSSFRRDFSFQGETSSRIDKEYVLTVMSGQVQKTYGDNVFGCHVLLDIWRRPRTGEWLIRVTVIYLSAFLNRKCVLPSDILNKFENYVTELY